MQGFLVVRNEDVLQGIHATLGLLELPRQNKDGGLQLRQRRDVVHQLEKLLHRGIHQGVRPRKSILGMEIGVLHADAGRPEPRNQGARQLHFVFVMDAAGNIPKMQLPILRNGTTQCPIGRLTTLRQLTANYLETVQKTHHLHH